MNIIRATIEGSYPYEPSFIQWQKHFMTHRAAETALKNEMDTLGLDYNREENKVGDTAYVHYLEVIEVLE